MNKSKNQLALYGGTPVITKKFERFNRIGSEEMIAVQEVMKKGVLSRFLGEWDPDFYGGEKVQQFESEWASYFKSKYAISVNSNTSGLISAIGAIGVEPGDQIIVSPWTMCASATSILVWNAIPVFVDIELDTYNLDPEKIEKAINEKTKAIVVTDIFGHPAKLDKIMNIARKYNLKVIEDAAQAPGAFYSCNIKCNDICKSPCKNKYAGTVADIGVFSLNYHKHIHTGEGGMCVTNNDKYAERLRLIRNHGESSVADAKINDISNIIGFNFRMGEIEAAIGIEQLKKLSQIVKERQNAAEQINKNLRNLEGLKTFNTLPNCSHSYYVLPFEYFHGVTGVPKDLIVRALRAEGVSIGDSYKNLHLLPMYQKKIAYGKKGFPWINPGQKNDVSYDKGICPVAESLNERYLDLGMCAYDYNTEQVQLISDAFVKVWKNLKYLLKN
jgi:perosamine synthetase